MNAFKSLFDFQYDLGAEAAEDEIAKAVLEHGTEIVIPLERVLHSRPQFETKAWRLGFEQYLNEYLRQFEKVRHRTKHFPSKSLS